MRLLLTCLLSFLIGASALATPADPKPGIEYTVLAKPQPTDTGKKIEVIEFFAYYCPHCYVFQAPLAAWIKKHGDSIVHKRVHLPYNESSLPQQRLFYTLEALGLVEQYHAKFFHAIHVEKLRMSRDEYVFDWITKQGIDRQKFIDTYRSFGVAAKVKQADAMKAIYQIEHWPRVSIDGKWVTGPVQASEGIGDDRPEAEQIQFGLQVLDILVAKAKAEKK